MKNRTIKDPTYSIYKDGGNVENKAKAAGKDELLKLAKDEADIRFDVEGEIIDILQENYQKEKKPGQSFLDWLDTKPRSYFFKNSSFITRWRKRHLVIRLFETKRKTKN